MIKVNAKVSNKDDRYLEVVIKGHANYDDPGKDIVCSAVSALAISAINSAELLLNVDLAPTESNKDGGYLYWEIPEIDDPEIDDKLQFLMKALVESLKMLETDYQSFIKVKVKAS